MVRRFKLSDLPFTDDMDITVDSDEKLQYNLNILNEKICKINML